MKERANERMSEVSGAEVLFQSQTLYLFNNCTEMLELNRNIYTFMNKRMYEQMNEQTN